MSLHDQFDELARQKLEERAFPFDEGAWLSARQDIAEQRRKRKGAWYLLGLIPLAFIAWLLWPANEQAAAIADASASMNQATPTDNKPENNTPLQVEPETGDVTGSNTGTTGSRMDAAPATVAQTSSISVAGTAESADRHNPSAPIQMGTTTPQPVVPLPYTGSAAVLAAAAYHSPVDEHSSGHRTDGTTELNGESASEEPEPVHSNDRVVAVVDPIMHAATSGHIDDPVADEPPAFEPESHDASMLARGTAIEAAIDLHPTMTDAQPAAPAVVADEPGISSAVLPHDSAMAEVPVPLPTPLITARSPWEISALFGAQRTMSRYASDRDDELDASTGDAIAFGAELVRMGRNVGFGFGVHHVSYNDRFTTPEQRTTAWEVTRNWFLQAIDTTILIITGSDTVNGQILHTGFNVNTTVQVLRYSFDTTAIVSVRSSRAFNVRTSYIEVPLLLDAHIVQGRWSFGVRGGPSISLLSARSGSLPSENDGADMPLRDAAVKQWSLGWSARAYARYRFNSAWSVGLEPMARGQLIDAINGPVITRRSTAYGALLSLNYQLR